MGLEQEFSSLDAQREACLAYIQQQPGWALVEQRYEDGGFTGATLDRPGFMRLLADVDAGQIDVIVVYKIDRLSRSLVDFAKVIERLAAVGASFVSVTQNFSTADAVGRLTMNLLMTFAEFERSIIAERTRDKILGARRRGKWTGGTVPFGYRAKDKKLVVHEEEAHVVREAFTLFLQHRQVATVVRLLNANGLTARPSTRGRGHRGDRWTSAAVDRVLRNAIYAGLARCQDRLYAAEHVALIGELQYKAAQQLLHAPRVSLSTQRSGAVAEVGRTATRNAAYVLRGILRCGQCDIGMAPSSTKKGERTHRYYRCTTREKYGKERCAAHTLPADAVEDLVAERLATAFDEPCFLAELERALVARVEYQRQSRAKLKATLPDQIAQTAMSISGLGEQVGRLAGTAREAAGSRLQEEMLRLADLERRLAELDLELAGLEVAAGETQWMLRAMRDFRAVWELMTTENRGRLMRALLVRVRVDESTGVVELELQDALSSGVHEAPT